VLALHETAPPYDVHALVVVAALQPRSPFRLLSFRTSLWS
jgi:hypothetical protein